MKLRGYATVFVAGLVLVLLDIVQRTVIAVLVKLLPGRRHRILGAWQRWIARLVLGLIRFIGGARVEPLPRIPGRPGVLIVMNHQSLLDIPLMVASLDDLYPRIVTRSRYARGKPLISHMVRLYQYPVVDPRATTKNHLEDIDQAAATSAVPLAIFPEGTRSRNGEIGRFRRGGITRILRARTWTVYVLVADGFWQAATLQDFLGRLPSIRGRIRCIGPFDWTDPEGSVEDFTAALKERMTETLDEMRGTGAS